jgi:hypothetical protein
MLRSMKIGEWDNLGKARALIQRQLGELGTVEYAAHVTVNPENGRLRIFVATDAGLFEYQYAPAGADPQGPWILRGQVHRWSSIRGLRFQTDAQIDETTDEVRGISRLVAEDPRIELSATTAADSGDQSAAGLMPFAKACLQLAG